MRGADILRHPAATDRLAYAAVEAALFPRRIEPTPYEPTEQERLALLVRLFGIKEQSPVTDMIIREDDTP